MGRIATTRIREGAEGRGRIVSRTMVAADEEIDAVKTEEAVKTYPEVKENQQHYNNEMKDATLAEALAQES